MSADIVGDLRRVEAERDLLAKAMWDARTELGFDPDGDDRFHSTDWRLIARQHVIEAIQQRTDSEVAIEELEAERDALRTAVERVRALADEYECGGTCSSEDPEWVRCISCRLAAALDAD